jgi:YHS domain-containing protein
MVQRRLLGIVLFAGFISVLGVLPASAQNKDLHHRYDLTGESIGLVGYDPVAYFPEGGGHPQKGLYKLSFEFDGVTYRFATQKNLDRFKAAPSNYLPQYGGWCAFGAAFNVRGDADPESFVIRDGKLYVFYRDPGGANRDAWLKDPVSYLQKADANWPTLSN